MEAKYIAIYRRFRPETFDKVLGQEHVVRVLRSQIAEGNVGHAYLFSGTRGTGKTTMARLLAKGVNCLHDGEKPCGVCENCVAIRNGAFIDVVEIDAASNNGVDSVRELRESVVYPPSVGRKKVFIIDEVHMFSKGAFNALLKTLEEPPEHIIFILATTEPNKLPATIQSRCLRFDFKRIAASGIMKGMRDICAEMGIRTDDEALALLAGNADGSVRDALSLLEQCVSAGADAITRDFVLEILGSPGDHLLSALTDDVATGKIAEALVLLDEILAAGKDEKRVIEEWIHYFHSALLIKFIKNPARILNRSVENIDRIREQSGRLEVKFINDCIYRLSKLLNDTRWSAHTRILLEMTIIELGEGAPLLNSDREARAVARPEGQAEQ
ncbi:MAG: DNA polymerase III subunit gamma/tau [Clostridiales Family XIII bacterium]|nr:DNA polymerase III subunit gamma/tau [Clostridiales Family XIII bacterium]